MGGCRCTYRNCTAKSDGKVHLFHYPVFERVRCHQWLLNANRLDFLNLRLSQLKNRVVCQHHFKDDNFMNYKKDKLTFDAIPTEDGPYCDPSEWVPKLEDSSKVNPIILEDIENECCAVYDKKANFSVRYGDFLTNFSEVMGFRNTDESRKITLSNENKDLNLKPNYSVNDIDDNTLYKNEPIYPDSYNVGYKPLQNTNKPTTQPTLKVVPYIINQEMNNSTPKKMKIKKDAPKIRIISEKKIKEPIAITGTFTKVSPSITLPPPNKNNLVDIKPIKEEVNNDCPLKNISFDKSYVVQVEFEPAPVISNENNNKVANSENNSIAIEKLKQIPSPSSETKISQLKNKLTPERKAAINSKREFNKKMRNFIEACLTTKESGEASTKEDIKKEKKPIRLKPKEQILQKFKPHPRRKKVPPPLQNITEKQTPPQNFTPPPPQKNDSPPHQHFKPPTPKEPILSNIQESTIAYLEARIQKLESNLVSRIDQNTKLISELQGTLAKGSLTKKDSRVQTSEHQANYKKISLTKKDRSVQTNEHQASYKKLLFQEISRFLSPNCNSIIYEELFINKYAISDGTIKQRNKRRRES